MSANAERPNVRTGPSGPNGRYTLMTGNLFEVGNAITWANLRHPVREPIWKTNSAPEPSAHIIHSGHLGSKKARSKHVIDLV